MTNNNIFKYIVVAICLLLTISIPSFSQNSPNPEYDAWIRISGYLNCFFDDPLTHFPFLERIDDLFYWTSIYNKLKNTNFLKELISKKFPTSDIDEIKLNVLFYLLKAYSSPTSYETLKPIISKIIDISSVRPEWFMQNLLNRDDRRDILRLLSEADIDSILGQRKGLQEILLSAGNHEVTKELIDIWTELYIENQKNIKKYEEFMKDPAGNLDRIRGIYNLCATMGSHDDQHLDENKTLWPKDNSLLVLQDWIKNNIDKKKIRVLFYLLSYCDSAYHSEVIKGTAVNLLLKHQQLFVSVLKDEPRWRMIILTLVHNIHDWERHFNKTIRILGNSGFEVKLKFQLEFLRENIK